MLANNKVKAVLVCLRPPAVRKLKSLMDLPMESLVGHQSCLANKKITSYILRLSIACQQWAWSLPVSVFSLSQPSLEP